MEKQLGILIMKDENDILEEYLTKITQYYDPIYVLDGSDSDEGREICGKFPEVVFYEKDKNVIEGKSTDAIRGFLWEKAKREVVGKSWVAILHPDEFPETNPLDMLAFVSKNSPDTTSIIVRSLHFFLHTSQKDEWKFEKGDLIEPLMKWHMGPGMTEFRFFKFDPEFSYDETHHQVIPAHADMRKLSMENFRIKQFSFRTPEQARERIKNRIESGWSPYDYMVFEGGEVFVETLKWSDELILKHPREANICWYNRSWAFVDKLD
jgi:hypothetical protein